MRIFYKYRGRDFWEIGDECWCGKHEKDDPFERGTTTKFPVKMHRTLREKKIINNLPVTIYHTKKIIDNLLDSNIIPKGYVVVGKKRP